MNIFVECECKLLKLNKYLLFNFETNCQPIYPTPEEFRVLIHPTPEEFQVLIYHTLKNSRVPR